MITYISIFLLVLCSVSISQRINAQEIQCEQQPIEQINIEIMNLPPNSYFDPSSIISRMKIREGGVFTQTDFDNDLKKLAQDFDRVDPAVHCLNGRVYVTLKIWTKPRIRHIHWHGFSKLTAKELMKELGNCGVLFDRCVFTEAFHKVKAYCVKQGFFEAQLSYDVETITDSDCNEVDIHITIDEGRAGRIQELCFVNFTPCEEQEVLDLMTTKPYSFFTSWFYDTGTYKEDMMQQDELLIINYLQNQGFADAVVKIDVREVPDTHRIIVTITADKGCPYYFGTLTFEGNEVICDEDIWKSIGDHEGKRFSPEKIRDMITRVTNRYGKYGYIDACVNYEPKLRCDEYVYDVHFKIEEGEQYRVGLIKVFGNYWTQPSVILHETFLVPGEVFNLEKLQKTEERLTNIGFFRCVNVYAVKSEDECDQDGNYRDVHIEVEETSTGNFGLFFGFSTAESIFGGLNITETNFNHKGLNCFMSQGLRTLRGAGEYLSLNATLGAKSRNYGLSWSKPYFMDTPWTVGFDLDRTSNRYISDDYDIESTCFTIRGIYPLNAYMRLGAHYRLKYTHIDTPSHKASHKLREEAHNSGFLAGFGGSFVYDSTNHPLFPTRGYKSRIESEVCNLSGQRMFVSLSYLNTYFFQLEPYDCKGVWKVKWDARFIQPLFNTTAGRVPIDERFFLGGDYTVRGYRPFRLGPKYPHSDDPRGGISMQYLSLEYSVPLWKRLELFCFADAGHISQQTWHFGQFAVAVGYGLKIPIFAGTPPLILGYGFPLNPHHKTDVKRFFLSVGGRF